MDPKKIIKPEDAPSQLPFACTLCITGHRPEKLPKGERLEALLRAMNYQLELLIPLGFRYFLTGMADGIDYYASHHLFEMRKSNPDIKVIGVSPCSDYREFYTHRGYSLAHLDEMEDCIDSYIALPGQSAQKNCFLIRDCFMVEASSGILAVCRDGRSGSSYTFRHAQSKQLSYCRLFPTSDTPYLPAPEDWPMERSGL